MKAAAILWRLALAALLFTATWQVWQLRLAPQWMAAQIERQGAETRAAALSAISDTRRDLDLRVDRLIDVSQESIQDIARRSDDRLVDLTERLDRQLTAANASVAEVAKLRGDMGPLLPPIQHTLDVASENADLLGRCATEDPETGEWIGNPDCFANRIIPALKNVEHMAAAGERMANAIEKETPATAVAVRSTSQDLARIVDRFARPVSWIKSALMAGVGAAAKVLFLDSQDCHNMNIFKSFFAKVAAFFSSGEASKALNTAAALVPKVIPYLDIAAEIAAGITPTGVDDALLAQIHAKFPRLFDGSLTSGDEVKLYLLGVATQLVQQAFPKVSTSVARAAVQVAYTAQHA